MIENYPTVPEKYPVVVQVVVQVAAPEIWQLIEQPQFLKKIHPFVANHTMVHWPGKNARDIVEYYSGLTIHRHIFEWSATSLKLDAYIEGEKQIQGRWDIVPKTDTETEVKLFFKPVSFREYPQVIRSLIYQIYINRMLKTYTQYALKGLIHYFETGQPVKPNQFGKMRHFSY